MIDAKASMALYRISEQEWEAHIKQQQYSHAKQQAEHDVHRLRNNLFSGREDKKLNKKAKKRRAEEQKVSDV